MNEMCCKGCRDLIDALDRRIDQRFIDADKRHDERFVGQRDYNVQHNSLQRMMNDNADKMISRADFGEKHETLKDRITKLERWPWLAAILFAIAQAGMLIVFKLLKW